MTTASPLKVAIIGTGVAGLSAASELFSASKSFGVVDPLTCNDRSLPIEITCYESGPTVGGHAYTLDVPLSNGKGTVAADGGFMVLNPSKYPQLLDWFDRHGVEVEHSDMSFSVNLYNADLPKSQVPLSTDVAWSSDSLSTLFASWKSKVTPGMYRILYNMVSFKSDVETWLRSDDVREAIGGSTSADATRVVHTTLKEWLDARGYREPFVSAYVYPMAGATWSCEADHVAQFPALFFLQFLYNHQLLDLTGRPQWLTVAGRTRDGYVNKVTAPFRDRIRLSCGVTNIKKTDAGLEVTSTDGKTELYNAVVVATHAPDAVPLVANAATPQQTEMLKLFGYQSSDVCLHSDKRFLPEPKLWASWNFFQRANVDASGAGSGRFVSYNINRLQNLDTSDLVIVTLWPSGGKDETMQPDPETISHQWKASHPVPTAESFDAIRTGRWSAAQGDNGLYFCGAYTGFGFHEDGFISGLRVARQLIQQHTGLQVNDYGVPPTKTAALTAHVTPRLELLGLLSGTPEPQSSGINALSASSIAISWSQSLARRTVHAYLRKFIQKGSLTIIEAFGGGEMVHFGNGGKASHRSVVRVHDPSFYTKVAFEHDIGLGRSYIDGDFKARDLEEFFLLMIANRDTDNAVGESFSSFLGRYWNKKSHEAKANVDSEATLANISAHYDQSNDMFGIFLDKNMLYSCAIWPDNLSLSRHDMSDISDSFLGEAQMRKVDTLLAKARIQRGNTLLEIGSGWGALSVQAAKKYGCKVWGITQSKEQLAFSIEVATKAGVADLCHFQLVDYRNFKTPDEVAAAGGFDRIISCEMIEAVGHEFLPKYYEVLSNQLRDGGYCVVQAITTPDSRYESYRTGGADFIQTFVFPGGICPSLGALELARGSGSKERLQLLNVENYADHYAYTLEVWRRRFLHRREMLLAMSRDSFNDSFARLMDYYFSYCAAGFGTGTLGLLQLVYGTAKS